MSYSSDKIMYTSDKLTSSGISLPEPKLCMGNYCVCELLELVVCAKFVESAGIFEDAD